MQQLMQKFRVFQKLDTKVQGSTKNRTNIDQTSKNIEKHRPNGQWLS